MNWVKKYSRFKNGDQIKAYVDAVDFDHEFHTIPTTFYTQLHSLENRHCIEECGLYRVRIVVEEFIPGPFAKELIKKDCLNEG